MDNKKISFQRGIPAPDGIHEDVLKAFDSEIGALSTMKSAAEKREEDARELDELRKKQEEADRIIREQKIREEAERKAREQAEARAAEERARMQREKEEAKKLLRPQSFHVNVRTCGAMGRL